MTCILCGGTSFVTIADTLRGGIPRNVVQCTGCGLISLEHPEQSSIDYAGAYRKQYNPVLGQALTAEEHYRQTPIDSYVERTKHLLTPDMALLEVGCASGGYLGAVERSVSLAVGVEPNDEHREFCRSRNLIVMPNLEHPPTTFDVIVAFQVLEHIADPLPFLAQVRRLLAPGGRVYFEVPNLNDALLSLYESAAFREHFFCEAHAYYYSAVTLGNLMAKAGFVGDVGFAQDYSLTNHLHWELAGGPQPTMREGHSVIAPPQLRPLIERFDQEYRQELSRLGATQHLTFEGRVA